MRHQLLLVFMMIGFSSLSQNKFDSYVDPYFECFKIHLNLLKEQEVYLDTVYVQKREFIQDFSGNIDGVYVAVIQSEFVRDKTKKGKSLRYISINPVVFGEENTSITIIDFSVSRRRNHYIRINHGGTKIAIEYDCDIGRYSYELVYVH